MAPESPLSSPAFSKPTSFLSVHETNPLFREPTSETQTVSLQSSDIGRPLRLCLTGIFYKLQDKKKKFAYCREEGSREVEQRGSKEKLSPKREGWGGRRQKATGKAKSGMYICKMQKQVRKRDLSAFRSKSMRREILTTSPADFPEIEAGFSYTFLQDLRQELLKRPFACSHGCKQARLHSLG